MASASTEAVAVTMSVVAVSFAVSVAVSAVVVVSELVLVVGMRSAVVSGVGDEETNWVFCDNTFNKIGRIVAKK